MLVSILAIVETAAGRNSGDGTFLPGLRPRQDEAGLRLLVGFLSEGTMLPQPALQELLA